MEIFLYLSIILIGGLGFCLGSLFSPRIKSLKADLKYTEGKLHRERQNNKEAKDEQGFDLNPFKDQLPTEIFTATYAPPKNDDSNNIPTINLLS